jgi:hypothetical protein
MTYTGPSLITLQDNSKVIMSIISEDVMTGVGFVNALPADASVCPVTGVVGDVGVPTATEAYALWLLTSITGGLALTHSVSKSSAAVAAGGAGKGGRDETAGLPVSVGTTLVQSTSNAIPAVSDGIAFDVEDGCAGAELASGAATPGSDFAKSPNSSLASPQLTFSLKLTRFTVAEAGISVVAGCSPTLDSFDDVATAISVVAMANVACSKSANIQSSALILDTAAEGATISEMLLLLVGGVAEALFELI